MNEIVRVLTRKEKVEMPLSCSQPTCNIFFSFVEQRYEWYQLPQKDLKPLLLQRYKAESIDTSTGNG
jgi:hypothetical protein